MGEEKVRILQMLEEGKINVDEANDLLNSLQESEDISVVKNENNKISSLKIRISENGDEKVNISLPLSVARGLISFIPQSAKSKLKDKDINLDELLNSIKNLDEPQEIVNISDKGDQVLIRLE